MSDADEIVRAELADELPQLPQPPLSIAHLLLWILGSALVLGSYRWLAEPAADEGPRRLVFHLDQFARSLTLGGGVAALLVYARRSIVGDAPLPRQPGHWLLVVQGVHWPAYWLAILSIYGLRGRPWGAMGPRDEALRYAATNILYYLWAAAVYAVVVFCLRDARRWRMYFAVCAVLPFLHALLWCCLFRAPSLWTADRSVVLVRIAITLPLLALCVLRDRRQALARDWMHAAGLGFYVVGTLLYLANFLVLMFLAS